MIAVDTNLLVYAHRCDSPFHQEAAGLLSQLATGSQRWGIPWPCVHEFIAVVTHPRIYKTPSSLQIALDAVRALQDCPTQEFLGEGDGYMEQLVTVAMPAKVQGGAIHDARIAAICRYHGVRELWSADRDFSRFGQIKVRNPLLG
jgi:toxin-antitoxin system PIN domain toxin